jgi:N-acetylglutamate synthase-like GNAT family acetyltransferase
MIKKTELFEELSPFCKTVFGCRIQSTAAAYGLDKPFAQFWTQGEKAALCKLDDVVTLDAVEGANFEEIVDFIRMTGARRVLCSSDAARKIKLPVMARGEIMVYHNENRPDAQTVFEQNPSLREIHALLCMCATDTFLPPEFEPFYMDLSHRIRHGAATAVGIRQGQTMASCAICVAQTADQAIVSAVAAKPELQRKGFGRAALAALISQLKQEQIYILRAQDENEGFYRSFGFIPSGQFIEFTI